MKGTEIEKFSSPGAEVKDVKMEARTNQKQKKIQKL